MCTIQGDRLIIASALPQSVIDQAAFGMGFVPADVSLEASLDLSQDLNDNGNEPLAAKFSINGSIPRQLLALLQSMSEKGDKQKKKAPPNAALLPQNCAQSAVCPGDHALIAAVPSNGEPWTCSACGTAGSCRRANHCEACQYDVCDACYDQLLSSKQAAVVSQDPAAKAKSLEEYMKLLQMLGCITFNVDLNELPKEIQLPHSIGQLRQTTGAMLGPMIEADALPPQVCEFIRLAKNDRLISSIDELTMTLGKLSVGLVFKQVDLLALLPSGPYSSSA
jgi:hypothetical protein